MKRGFLNTKKVKEQPLYNHSASETKTASVQSDPSGGGPVAVSYPKKQAEPFIGYGTVLDQVMPVRYLEPGAIVRIPSLNLTKSKEPSTICIFRNSVLNIIMNTPGYYTPLPKADPADVVVAKPTPDLGIGLFAKRSIKTRQLIFSERPLLVHPQGWPTSAREGPGISKEEVTQKAMLMVESFLQQAFGIMTKEDADAFLSLSNCHPGSPQLYGISYTNAFDTGIEEQNMAEGKTGYAVIGRLASRINHSCMQNVLVNFDIATFSLQVSAVREIKAGEQLFYCYCQADRSVKERRRQLATYGFVCKCKACVNATPESDKLREEMEDIIQQIINEKKEMFASPGFNARSLRPLLELEKAIVKDGLDFKWKFIDLLDVIRAGYEKLNIIAKMTEYYNKEIKYRGL